MRRRISIALMFLVPLSLLTCSQEADRIVYNGPDFVFLDTKPQLSIYENQKTPLVLPVKVSLAQKDNVNVTFEVTGTNVLPVSDYVVQTPSPVMITRGQYSASISVLPVNNNVIQPELRTITIKIKSVDPSTLTVQVVNQVDITILDDDCLPTVPKVSIWTGSVNIQSGSSTATGTADAGAGGICGGTLSVTGNFFGSSNPSSTMTIILTQGTLTPTKGFASVVRFQLFAGITTYEYEASGTYDETGKIITLNYTVYDTTDNSVVVTGTHIITPQ